MSSSIPSSKLSLKRRRHLRLLPAALLALAACGTTTRFAPLNPAPHPLRPRPAAMVQVFTTSVPARPYTEIGLIQGTQESEYSFDEMPQIIAAMRAEAGRIGCDGLVLNGPSSRGTESSLGMLSGAHHERTLEGFWGTCIAFLDQGSAAPLDGAVVVAPPPAHAAPVVAPPPHVAPAPAPVVVPPPPPRTEPAPAPAPAPVVVPPPPPRTEPAPAPAPAPVVVPPPSPRTASS